MREIIKNKRKERGFMKKAQFFILSMIGCMFLAFGMQNETRIAAEEVSVTTGSGITYIPESVSVSVDGKNVDLSEVPGIVYQGVCMVPALEVLEQNMGVACAYNKEDGIICLKKDNNSIEMQLNSKTATVNGAVVEMETGPFVSSSDGNVAERVFVPAEFVAEYLGYGYEEKINSDNQLCVQFISPLEVIIDGKPEQYLGNQIKKIVFNDKSYSLADDMVGMEINGVMMVPVIQAIEDSAIGGKVSIEDNEIVVKYQRNITFYKEGTTALVSGSKKEMPESIHEVVYNQDTYIMVPAEFLFTNLGMESVSIDVLSEKIVLKKSEEIGLDLITKPENASGNYMKKAVEYNKKTKDLLVFTFAKTPSVSVKSTSTLITITLNNVKINQNFDETIYGAKYIKSVSIKKAGKQLVIKIKKKKGKPFVYQYGNGKLYVHLGVEPIRIAVDCGHGANTPGKRSPKMPCNIDFEKDGIIDVKKGQSIREHQGNVGVGKYLAKELERCGFKVYRCAFGSRDVSLRERQQFVKKNKCKYSISVHFNAVGSGQTFNSANGVEVLYHSNSGLAKKSKSLAKRVVKEMAKGTKQLNRGAKPQLLALCNAKEMGTSASILVECAFMTNLHEAKTMFGNAKFWKETGEEIAQAMCDYAGVNYIEE